jgi:hypothetical protein
MHEMPLYVLTRCPGCDTVLRVHRGFKLLLEFTFDKVLACEHNYEKETVNG